MKKNIMFFTALTLAGALTLASCGKDEAEDSVTVDLPEMTVASDEETVTTTSSETTTKLSATTTKKTTDEATTTATTATAVVPGGIVVGGNQGGASEEPTEAPAFENPTEAPIPTTAPIQVAVPKPVSFSYGSLLSNASSTISSLGTPNDTVYAQGCLSNGADQKIYYYNGIEISCYVMDGVEYIYDITITGGSYATAEGITVGSSRSAVEAVYGAGEPAGNYVCYYSGDKELDIEYNGDTVVSIEYYTPV